MFKTNIQLVDYLKRVGIIKYKIDKSKPKKTGYTPICIEE